MSGDEYEVGWVQQSARELGIQLSRLSQHECGLIGDEVSRRFTPGHRNATWIWEHLIDGASLRDDDAWKKLDEFVDGAEVILNLNEIMPDAMFRLPAGASVVELIGDAPMFEFWLTNDRAEFVLGFNHHDVLYGAGTAKAWVESLGGSPFSKQTKNPG